MREIGVVVRKRYEEQRRGTKEVYKRVGIQGQVMRGALHTYRNEENSEGKEREKYERKVVRIH